jgi:NADPH-dependent 2,4-dienoyl-CoA reductase/sulfur reductase-like enzyme
MKTDVLVIGGGPAGVVAAVTAKKSYSAKKVTLIKKEQKSVIPCGIPYIFKRLNSVEQNLMSDQALLDEKIDLIIGEAIEIKPEEKEVILKNGDILNYDKLILALGSKSRMIDIPGVEKGGVWMVKKEYAYLEKFREAALKSKNVVIIGGGFIGMEFAEELSDVSGLNITLVEKEKHCLISNFDEEFAVAAEEKLKNKGVKIYGGKSVVEIAGNEKAEYVELDNGEKLPADLVIISVGAISDLELAQKANIGIEDGGSISVDEFLKTNTPDIFAVGDCVQTKDFITGKNISVMLASTATSEARIAAHNLYRTNFVTKNEGTVGAFCTSLGGLTFGAVGLIENKAQKEKLDYIVGLAEAPNRHPASLPGAEKIKVKLIFSKSSKNLLLGGEIMGPESAAEMLNILALAIQQKISIFDFNSWQIATHPLLTSAPTVYPIIAAAQKALIELEKNNQ